MNVLVSLDQDRRQEHAYFCAHLMSLVLENYEKIMQDGFGSTYLEHQIHLMSHPENRTAGAVDQQYRFSSTAQRLAYCFNYTRNRWTVVATDIYEGIWKHSVYNSM